MPLKKSPIPLLDERELERELVLVPLVVVRVVVVLVVLEVCTVLLTVGLGAEVLMNSPVFSS